MFYIVTAENLAKKYGISREECDAYALQSQTRWAKAQSEGAFRDEITPVSVKVKRAVESFEVDEHPRPQTTLASLAKLPSVFEKDTGTVTAGNASGIGDGAAANVIVSEEALKRYGIKPLARIVSYGISAVDPTIMGIGPVEAIKIALQRANLKLDDMDLIDVNEVCFFYYFLHTFRASYNIISSYHHTGLCSSMALGSKRTWSSK